MIPADKQDFEQKFPIILAIKNVPDLLPLEQMPLTCFKCSDGLPLRASKIQKAKIDNDSSDGNPIEVY